MTNGKANRQKGHNAERYFAGKFRDLGFDLCQTSRYGSRQLDDCKIDLINLPYNVQVKAGFQRGLNPSIVFKEMDKLISENLPKERPEHNYPKILIHRKQVGQGNTRTKYDDIVSMTFDDFVKIISKEEK